MDVDTKSTNINKEMLIELILNSLQSRQETLAAAFEASAEKVGVRFVAIDDLLPESVAVQISHAFPAADDMRLMDSFRERKFTSKAFDRFDPVLGDVTFAFQDPSVVAVVETITGIAEQVPDSLLYAGGLSMMAKGHFLGPHIDNSHDSSRQYYRTLNLLYYASEDWSEENGGNLHLWDKNVDGCVAIHSKFNRLVLMETTPTSWHSVNSVKVDRFRKCVSNYYFSKRSPTGSEYFNVTSFSAPKDQPVLRFWNRADAVFRQTVRMFRPDGVGPVDVYDGPPR